MQLVPIQPIIFITHWIKAVVSVLSSWGQTPSWDLPRSCRTVSPTLTLPSVYTLDPCVCRTAVNTNCRPVTILLPRLDVSAILLQCLSNPRAFHWCLLLFQPNQFFFVIVVVITNIINLTGISIFRDIPHANWMITCTAEGTVIIKFVFFAASINNKIHTKLLSSYHECHKIYTTLQ